MQVGLAALSASLEIKPSSFGRATCEKILEIYQGALVGSTHTPANAAPVISSLASTIESLLRSLHESGAEKEWQVCRILRQEFAGGREPDSIGRICNAKCQSLE